MGEGQRVRGLALQDDQDDEITAVLDRLHVGGWSVGDTAFHDVDRGGIIHVVIGSNGENMIRAEGATCREAGTLFHSASDPDALTLCPGAASTQTMSQEGYGPFDRRGPSPGGAGQGFTATPAGAGSANDNRCQQSRSRGSCSTRGDSNPGWRISC
jgi:hypothetical protein